MYNLVMSPNWGEIESKISEDTYRKTGAVFREGVKE